jgi:hypothetical protein
VALVLTHRHQRRDSRSKHQQHRLQVMMDSMIFPFDKYPFHLILFSVKLRNEKM